MLIFLYFLDELTQIINKNFASKPYASQSLKKIGIQIIQSLYKECRILAKYKSLPCVKGGGSKSRRDCKWIENIIVK